MKWIMIDSDNNQYRLDEGQNLMTDKVYTFKQDGFDGVVEDVINLDDYSDEEILNIISSYGYSKDENGYFVENYHPIENSRLTLDVIAECIFEYEQGF